MGAAGFEQIAPPVPGGVAWFKYGPIAPIEQASIGGSKLDLPVGLGADWLPSGSTSLLAELKVARRCLAQRGQEPKPAELVDMVTRDAARIAGLEEKLGQLAEGPATDLLPLRVRGPDRVALHADLTILATLACALARARAVPLAA